MSPFCFNEHQLQRNYDNRPEASIETVVYKKGQWVETTTTNNEIVCLMEGSVQFCIRDFFQYKGEKGQLLFFTAGEKYTYQVIEDARVIIFHFENTIAFCENLMLEKLYKENAESTKRKSGSLNLLVATSQIWAFLCGLDHHLIDGIYSPKFFEIKKQELLFFFHFCYTQEDLYNFFFFILSKDIAFSEYVRLHWRKFHSVQAFAYSLHLSYRQFYNRFIAVFGQQPQKWMRENLAREIRIEITTTDKPFKLIAAEYGFSSETQFTRFCRDTMSNTPTAIRSEIQSI